MYFVCILGEDVMFFEKWQRLLLPTRRYRRCHLQFGFFRSLLLLVGGDRGVVLPQVCRWSFLY